MKRIVLWLVVPALALTLLYTARAPLALRVFERAIERNFAGDPFGALPDGLHVVLCGAGGPLPDPRRSGPCVGVQAGKLHLVIDAGSGGVRSLTRMRYPVGAIDAVLLTHFHSDHIDGLGELAMLRWVNAANTEPLPVLGPQGVAEVVAGFNAAYRFDAGFRHAHHGDTVAPLAGTGMVATEWPLPGAGEALPVLERDGVRVSMFAVDHAPVGPAVGYRIEYGGRSVVLSGDTKRSPNLEAIAKGTDLLVHEALSPELVGAMGNGATAAGRPITAKVAADIPDYHTSPVEAARSAAAAGARTLLIYHVIPPLILPGMEAVFMRGVPEAFAGRVLLGRDGSMVSLPAGSDTIGSDNLL